MCVCVLHECADVAFHCQCCLIWFTMCAWLNWKPFFCLFVSLSSTRARYTYLSFYIIHYFDLLSVLSYEKVYILMCDFASSIMHFCVFLCVSRCAPGFLGEYCHHKDPCHPGYCLNGGNCSVSMSAGVTVPSSATCNCPLGYTGQHCQIPQNSTCYPNNPCANRGVCTLLSLDKYKCECARGWTGEILLNHHIEVCHNG